jgi:hypothetical protein
MSSEDISFSNHISNSNNPEATAAAAAMNHYEEQKVVRSPEGGSKDQGVIGGRAATMTTNAAGTIKSPMQAAGSPAPNNSLT